MDSDNSEDLRCQFCVKESEEADSLKRFRKDSKRIRHILSHFQKRHGDCSTLEQIRNHKNRDKRLMRWRKRCFPRVCISLEEIRAKIDEKICKIEIVEVTQPESNGAKDSGSPNRRKMKKSTVDKSDEEWMCKKCGHVELSKRNTSAIISHLIGSHLPPMICCPYCEYKARRPVHIRCHIKSNHPADDIKVIDNRWMHKDNVIKMMSKYFNRPETDIQSCKFLQKPGTVGPGNNCLKCGQINRDRGILSHILRKHLPPYIKCGYCDFGSRDAGLRIFNHIKDKHPGKHCVWTDERWKYKEKVIKAAKKYFNENLNLEKSEMFKEKSPITSSATGSDAIKCQKCGRNPKGEFLSHITHHHLPPMFECGTCKKRFKDKKLLTLHTKKIHKDISADFIDHRQEYTRKIMKLGMRCFNRTINLTSFSRDYLKTEDKKCQLCPGRREIGCFQGAQVHHIFKVHATPSYQCSLCKYTAKMGHEIIHHIKQKHPADAASEMIDNRWKIKDEMMEWGRKCFGVDFNLEGSPIFRKPAKNHRT